MKKAAIHTLGCKVNTYESDAMRELLLDAGYEMVPFSEKADVYIVNTCSVTNVADHKSRQMLHRAKKQNPDAILVACGCYVQTATEEAKKDAGIDILIGNNQKKDLIYLLGQFEKEKESACCISDISKDTEYEALSVSAPSGHTRAFLKVQDGCNQFCSYCIIPYARGRIRSRAPQDVYDEVKQLSQNGFQEIVLTGIHLSSYGKEIGTDLLSLIEKIHTIDGIRRIRLGSLEPGIITDEFVSRLSSLKKVCPHFHLSLQSGSDTVLKRMNRHYTSAEYLEKCRILRKYYTDPALTTDIIVGFPGETQEEFEDSCKIVRQAGFADVHIFKFSRRSGTPADKMPDQITEARKTERSHALSKVCAGVRGEFLSCYEGRKVEVLFEKSNEKDGVRYYEGYTPEYLRVCMQSAEDLKNQIKVVEFSDRLL